MTFLNSYQNFLNMTPCVDSFKHLRDDMSVLTKDSEYGNSGYYLIEGFCHGFILLYDEEAVESEIVTKAKETMISYLEIFKVALDSGCKKEILSAIDQITKNYKTSGNYIFN